MTKTEFAGFIREHGPVILDGATGTNLMEAGMPIECVRKAGCWKIRRYCSICRGGM